MKSGGSVIKKIADYIEKSESEYDPLVFCHEPVKFWQPCDHLLICYVVFILFFHGRSNGLRSFSAVRSRAFCIRCSPPRKALHACRIQ
jgi:hypothetical protein